MNFMNDYDLDNAVSRFTRATKPNRLGLALVVRALAEETNWVSDGWHSWPKPCRAAARAISLIESRTYRENEEQERTDITDAEFRAAVTPIKSFLTRHAHVYNADRRERILRAAEDVL
jgi:hypothetical protein